MKNIFKSLMLVAVAAMTFTACTQENNEVNAVKKGTTLTITADLAADDTRVAFGEADANGVRKTLWEAGDMVSFVVYRNDAIYTFVNDLKVAEAGATANFTVEFPETLQAGDRIEALVGKYVAESYGWYWLEPYEYGQNPTDDGLSTVYVKAVAEYDGNDVVSLTFKHQNAYGKMTTDYAVKFVMVSFEFTGINEYGNESTMPVSINPNNISGNDYWFYTDSELSDITKISISAYDSDYTKYAFTKDIDASVGFKFVVGEISAFTVNDFGIVINTPDVEATEVTVDSIKFDWEDVENATGYDVVLKKGYDTVVAEESVTVSEYVATELEAGTEYYIVVVATTTVDGYANSGEAETSAKTEADQSALDAEYTDAVTFTKMAKVTMYDSVFENAYKFTTKDVGGTTRSDDFMFLKFYTDITAQDGVYEGYDLDLSWCYCWLASNPAEWGETYGYSDNYAVGFKPYHCYMNPGDTYIVYVDVDEENPGTLSVTAYLNNTGWWADVKFKGSFTGEISEAEAPTAGNAGSEEEGGEIVEGEEIIMTATSVSIRGAQTTDQYFTFYDADGNMFYFNWWNDKVYNDNGRGYTPNGGSLTQINVDAQNTFTYEYSNGTITCSGRFVLTDGRVVVLEEVTLTY